MLEQVNICQSELFYRSASVEGNLNLSEMICVGMYAGSYEILNLGGTERSPVYGSLLSA